jgi:hypothetical protein
MPTTRQDAKDIDFLGVWASYKFCGPEVMPLQTRSESVESSGAPEDDAPTPRFSGRAP